MERRVASTSDSYRLSGPGGDVELANQFLAHLGSRAFSPATVRAYAYDLLNFLRFLDERRAGWVMWWRPTCSITWTGSSGRGGRRAGVWCDWRSGVAPRQPR